MQFSNYDDYSELYKHLTISKFGVPRTKFFLRAELFLQLVENRFWDKGLYILDEPEAALSSQRQMILLCYIHDLAKNGSQFIIATHSPILLSYKYAKGFV